MKFFSLLRRRDVRSCSSSPWAWPSCNQSKTLSFRVTTTNTKNSHPNDNDDENDNSVLRNINSAIVSQTPESFFTESPDSASFSTASELSDPVETVIRGLRSDRLFFEPDEASRSILEANKLTTATVATTTTDSLPVVPFKNSVALTVDSIEPYADFRKSMEEMMETVGAEDWESLEDLLCWYLSANAKSNHDHIIKAFVDLLFDVAVPNSEEEEEHSRPSSPLSFYSSSSPSSSCGTHCVHCINSETTEIGGTSTSSFSRTRLQKKKMNLLTTDII